MIARALAFFLALFFLGFALFSFTLEKQAPADLPKTDAAVVLTGGGGRIEHAIAVLKAGKVKRVLIAGADPVVTQTDLIKRLGGEGRLVKCCVDLGSESVDTRSNAEEAGRWLERNGFSSLRLITSDWHMRRSSYEFRRELGSKYRIYTDAVASEPSFLTLFKEYYKYVLRRIAVWADI